MYIGLWRCIELLRCIELNITSSMDWGWSIELNITLSTTVVSRRMRPDLAVAHSRESAPSIYIYIYN